MKQGWRLIFAAPSGRGGYGGDRSYNSGGAFGGSAGAYKTLTMKRITEKLTEESRSGRILRSRAITVANKTPVYGSPREYVF